MKNVKFKSISLAELKTVFGILIAMGITRMSDMRDHWSKRRFMGTPDIADAITYNRFSEIKTAIRFYDKRSKDNSSDVYKVKSILERIPTISKQLYTPSKHLSVDQSLVAFKGRSKFLLYMPLKSAKYGLKYFVVAEAKTGFMLDWRFFTTSNIVAHPFSENIVLDLTSYLQQNSGYHIYTDNFYTSLNLAYNLMNRGLGFTGVVRRNRKCVPSQLKNIDKVNKGPVYLRNHSSHQSRRLCFAGWQDNKTVLALSSVYGPGSSDITRRDRHTSGGHKIISMPDLISEYNQYMGGVDRLDQKLSYQHFEHSTKN